MHKFIRIPIRVMSKCARVQLPSTTTTTPQCNQVSTPVRRQTRLMASCGVRDPWAAYRTFGLNVATIALGSAIGCYLGIFFYAYCKANACNSANAVYQKCMSDNSKKPAVCAALKKMLDECKEKNK